VLQLKKIVIYFVQCWGLSFFCLCGVFSFSLNFVGYAEKYSFRCIEDLQSHVCFSVLWFRPKQFYLFAGPSGCAV